VNENDEKLSIDLEFKNFNKIEPLEVICSAKQSNSNDIQNYLKQINSNDYEDINILNITHAIPNEDFIFPNQSFKLDNPLEARRKISINILDDIQRPIMEGLKMFSIEIKTLGEKEDSCLHVNPNIIHIVIDDRKEDMGQIGFDQIESIIKVNETNRYLEIPIRRYGDVNQEFSIVCSTHPLSALEDVDYISRPINQEQSKVYFKKGDVEKNCLIELIDDSVYEADETFLVKLTNLKIEGDEANFKNSIKLLNDRNELTITILNDEDASVVYLSSKVYYTDEPTSSDTSVVKPLTIIRTGDLSRITIVRISTSDDTATAGKDYKQKTELIKFNPGVSALDFEIEILYDELNEPSESFIVTLGPLEPVSGIFGKVKSASVIIRESNGDATQSSNSNLIQQNINEVYSLFEKPFITSLKSYLENSTDSTQQRFVSNGEALICIHVIFFYNIYTSLKYRSRKSKCQYFLVN
jgi:hypothetical protein